MKTAKFILVVQAVIWTSLITSSCTRKLGFSRPCTTETILSEFEKHYYKTHPGADTEFRVTDLDSVYRIDYWPKNENTRGGGGKVEVSKNNCSIITQIIYQ